MDPLSEKQLEYEEDGNGGTQKLQCYGGGVTSEIIEEEMIGEDDDYDELYGDVNIGGGFQFQLSQAPGPSAKGSVNEVIDEDELYEELYGDLNFEEGFLQLHQSEAPCPSANGAMNTDVDPSNMLGEFADESEPEPEPVPYTSVQCGVAQMPPDISNDTGDNGATMLLVGELHWWTTDAEIESVSSKYGRVKEIKFFDEKTTGKSKGYCHVEFYDLAAAAACKEGMDGYNFNGRACTVKFSSPDTLWHMAASYMKKSQVQPQSQYEPERRPMNDNAESGSGRGAGRGSRVMRGSGAGRGSRVMRGTGLPGGPRPGYGDSTGPCFPRMMPPSWNVNAMGTPRVSPHVNPFISGKGVSFNRMRMTGSAGMDGPHSGMCNDGKWGAEEHGQRPRESSYDGEEGGSDYGYRESSHYKFPKSYAVSCEKERASDRDWSGNSNKRHRDERDHGRDRYDKERYDRERYHKERYDRERYDRERYHKEWYDRERYHEERYDRERYDRERYHKERYDRERYHEERYDRERYDREHRYKEEKDDWDRGEASSRYRSRSRVIEVDYRYRSRDADYRKRSLHHKYHAF